MSWMDTTIKPKTEMKGGLFAGLKRRMGGESFFLNTYTAEGGSGKIGIAPGYSGDNFLQIFQYLDPNTTLVDLVI